MFRLRDCFLRVVVLDNGVHALDRWAALRSDSGAVWAVQLAGTVGMPCSSRSLCRLAPRAAFPVVEALQQPESTYLNAGFAFRLIRIQGRL